MQAPECLNEQSESAACQVRGGNESRTDTIVEWLRRVGDTVMMMRWWKVWPIDRNQREEAHRYVVLEEEGGMVKRHHAGRVYAAVEVHA